MKEDSEENFRRGRRIRIVHRVSIKMRFRRPFKLDFGEYRFRVRIWVTYSVEGSFWKKIPACVSEHANMN